MKKCLALLLAGMMLTGLLAACGGSGSSVAGSEPAPVESASSEVQQEKAEDAAEAGQEETVALLLPASMIESLFGMTVEEYIEANGDEMVTVEVNEDGDIELVMPKEVHDALLVSVKENIDVGLDALVTASAYIVEITYNDDLTILTVVVDAATYGGELDASTQAGIIIMAAMYQTFNGEPEPRVVMVVEDESGNELNRYDSGEM